jgi:putative ABC transport system permease protein
LKPGISRHYAQASLDVIARRLATEYPSTDDKFAVRIIPEWMSRPAPFVSSFVPIIAALFLALAGMVLVLACINVANILLARATARQHEMGIRAALGAGRARLIRQVLTESLLLAALGGAAGVFLGKGAIAASGFFLHSIVTTSSNLGYSMDCSFDWRVFAYTLGAAVLTGVIAGLWPAFRAGRTEILTTLHEGARGASSGLEKHRVRSVLIVVQVACSLMLLVVAGLFVRSLGHAERMYLGFDPDHVLNVMLDPRQIGYSEARSIDLYRELVERVRAMPGVESASVAFSVPMSFPGHSDPLYLEGQAVVPNEQPTKVSSNSIDPGYLRTMHVPLLRGRDFRDSDNEKALQVAIVNQAMANHYWPNQDPLGKRFSLKGAGGPFIEVVGVAHDGQYFFLSPDSSPYFYVPFAQNPSAFAALQLRSSIPPEQLIHNVQQEINKLAPDLPAIDIHTMGQVVHGLAGMFIFRLAAALAGTMGILGLVLAVVGVYGVVSFSVTRRTQEIGIRIALGAERDDIIKLVSRHGLRLVTAGVGAGVVVALVLTRAMGKLLMGVSAADPATYAAVAILLSTVALLACYIPARRATRVDPMVALRYE